MVLGYYVTGKLCSESNVATLRCNTVSVLQMDKILQGQHVELPFMPVRCGSMSTDQWGSPLLCLFAPDIANLQGYKFIILQYVI